MCEAIREIKFSILEQTEYKTKLQARLLELYQKRVYISQLTSRKRDLEIDFILHTEMEKQRKHEEEELKLRRIAAGLPPVEDIGDKTRALTQDGDGNENDKENIVGDKRELNNVMKIGNQRPDDKTHSRIQLQHQQFRAFDPIYARQVKLEQISSQMPASPSINNLTLDKSMCSSNQANTLSSSVLSTPGMLPSAAKSTKTSPAKLARSSPLSFLDTMYALGRGTLQPVSGFVKSEDSCDLNTVNLIHDTSEKRSNYAMDVSENDDEEKYVTSGNLYINTSMCFEIHLFSATFVLRIFILGVFV